MRLCVFVCVLPLSLCLSDCYCVVQSSLALNLKKERKTSLFCLNLSSWEENQNEKHNEEDKEKKK